MTETATALTRSIRLHLADAGRSQGWLARQMGTTSHWVSRRMNGKTAWNTDDVDRVAEALEVPALALLAGQLPAKKSMAA